jgi:hypothetical protein
MLRVTIKSTVVGVVMLGVVMLNVMASFIWLQKSNTVQLKRNLVKKHCWHYHLPLLALQYDYRHLPFGRLHVFWSNFICRKTFDGQTFGQKDQKAERHLVGGHLTERHLSDSMLSRHLYDSVIEARANVLKRNLRVFVIS